MSQARGRSLSPAKGGKATGGSARGVAAAVDDAANEEKKKPPPYRPPLSKEELAKRRAAKLRRQRRLRKIKEAKQRAEEAAEAERKRLKDLADQRWRSCLKCLKDSVPALKTNPWLIVQEPNFVHDYLDALTETLGNLSKHEEDLDEVRSVLQDVYEAFVDLGKFAKSQPAFFIGNPQTIKRFVRLLDQVAHRGSDKALFPNVLSMLGPTFEREELYDFLAEARISHSLMSFARPPEWLPTSSTLSLLLQIMELLSVSARLRAMFMEDPGYDKLMSLAYGLVEGFNKEQQAAAQQALRLYPVPKRAEEAKAAAAAAAGLPSASPTSATAVAAGTAAATTGSATTPSAAAAASTGTGGIPSSISTSTLSAPSINAAGAPTPTAAGGTGLVPLSPLSPMGPGFTPNANQAAAAAAATALPSSFSFSASPTSATPIVPSPAAATAPPVAAT